MNLILYVCLLNAHFNFICCIIRGKALRNINNNFSIFDFIYFPFNFLIFKTHFNGAKLVVILLDFCILMYSYLIYKSKEATFDNFR